MKNTFISTLIFTLLISGSYSFGATITVNTPNDVNLTDGQCSLREAIISANTDPFGPVVFGECEPGDGDDIIEFAPSLNGIQITLSIFGTNEDSAGNGDLDINTNVVIAGNGIGNTIINGNGNTTGERVFHVDAMDSGITVEMNNLTITGGTDSTGFGGGAIRNNLAGSTLNLNNVFITGNSSTQSGGAVRNGSTSTLNIVDSTISNNSANNGVVRSDGTLNISGSTIHSNFAAANGGGVQNTGGILNMNNVTVSNNSTANAGGGVLSAGGNGSLNNVTIVFNSGGEGNGGGLQISSGSLSVSNTIVANNSTDCFIGGTLVNNGNNLDSDGSCSFTDPSDISNVDPLVAPLANNGGPSPTHALFEGSPAIDSGNNATCEGDDQRGVARPLDGDDDAVANCDIGSVEMEFSEIVPPDSSSTGCTIAGNEDPDYSLIILLLIPGYILLRKLRVNITTKG